MELCDHQVYYLNRITECALNSSIYLPTLLMVGPPSSGKRTICYHASRKMGIHFVDVSLKQPKEVIADQLFGSAAAAERAQESGVPPGILGQSSPVVVYLSDFQNVDLSLADSLYRTIKSRAYLDRLGTQWKLNEHLWLIGALTIPSPNSTIAYEHNICGAFQQTVLLAPPSSSADLLSICRSLSSDDPSPQEVATD